jgi:lipid II:glycine glycyltransferase (peptidoglycan interpeptide bridge formation enzyme)
MEGMVMYVERSKDEGEWEAFLQASPEGTLYHSIEWKKVIEKSFAHSSLYLTIKNENGAIVGLCPGFILNSSYTKFYHSTPYSDYGGPVLAKHCVKQASLSLRSFLHDFCSNKGIAYAKICFMNNKSGRFFKSRAGCVEKNEGIIEIDLKATPSDFIWSKVFSKDRRRKIRLVERKGFQAREARTRSDLRDFYNLYYENMRYIGASPYPYKFIENMWSILYPQNLRIWLLENDQRVAGNLFFEDGQRSYAALVGLERKQNVHEAINYLIWKEIKRAEEEGHRYVSLGGTPSDQKKPYYNQKMSFGGTFCQQEMVWYPFSSTGRIMLQSRAKTASVWKIIRNLLPPEFKRILESKLSRL